MGRFSPQKLISFIVILCVLQQSVFAAICKEGCPTPDKSTRYKFAPGTIYTYTLDSTSTILLAGKDAQETTLQVQGTFDIFAEANCKYTLKIQKLIVLGPDGKKMPLKDEITKPVQFYMSNAEMAPEICAEDGESEFSLNIKRGIVSLVQATEAKKYETDVFGVCQTSISSTETGGYTFVSKSRNLNACGHRETLSNGFMTGIVNDHAGVKSTPFISGDYSSELKIKAGILESVHLKEDYSYLPFSTNEAGAKAKVVTKITLKSQKAGAAPALKNGNAKTILFVNPAPKSLANVNTVKTVLKNVLDSYHNNVGSKTAGIFTELIRVMRYAKKDNLLQMYQQVKAGTIHENKALTRSVFFDALYRVGTGDSVEAISNLIKNKELTEKEQKLAYLSLNLVQSMTKDALNSVGKLLDGPASSYLAVGSLVNKYCQSHSCESADVKGIMEKYTTKLGPCKATTKDEEDLIISVLKGIKNTQNLYSPLLEKVQHCTTEKISTRIRVAALQAYAAASCDKKLMTSALTLLKNTNEDSEIRIQAFLALMHCPSATIANEIKTVLDNEKVYQVGAFMASYLASLRSTTEPSKEFARQHFGQIRSSNKFPFDPRRYSFNNEFSYAIESLGLGTSVDTNVIYSQKSFLPRSAALNVTAELFGSGFNVFELSARQENLDLVLEHYFGPKGIFTSLNLQDAFDKLVEHYQKLSEKSKGRFRRAVREDMKAFAKQVNMNNDVVQDINFDLSIKLFGSELFFLSLGDGQIPSTPDEFMDKFFDCLDKALNGAKNFDHTFEYHSLFFDTDLVYPTAAGLPLKLITQGTGVARLQATGQIDVKDIVKDFKNTKFQMKFVPSMNYEISGSLLIDGFAVATGLKVSGTVHSSTGTEVKFELLDGGKGYDLTISSPVKKQEVFSFEHKITFVTWEREHEVVEIPLRFGKPQWDLTNTCFDQLGPFIGVTFCTSGTFSGTGKFGTAPFPLNGENKFSLWLEVEPKYHFKTLYDDTNKKHQSILFAFETPDSENKRDTSLKLEAFFDGDAYVKATIVSPLKPIDVELGLKNNDKELALYVMAHMNTDEYLAKLGFSKTGGGDHQEYQPLFILKGANQKKDTDSLYKMEGKIIVDKSGEMTKYNFEDVQVSGQFLTPVMIKGYITHEGTKFETDLTITKDGKQGTVKGIFEFSGAHVNFDFSLLTDIDESLNGKISYQLARTETSFKNDLVMVHGKDFESKSKRFELAQNAVYEYQDKKLLALLVENKVLFPGKGFILKLDGDYKKNMFKMETELGYDKYKATTNVDAKYNMKSPGDYDVTIGGGLNKHNFKLITKRVVDNKKSKINNKFTTNAGTHIELNGNVGHKFTAQEADVNLEGLLIPGDKQEPYKFTIYILTTPAAANSNAKLTIGKTDFAMYDAKVVRGDNSNGKFSLVVTDLLDGSGEFKSEHGKGDASVLITFAKLDRKLKVDTKFNVKAPTYDVTTDFYYDFEKDNAKKVHFDTKNKAQKNDFDSKNILEIFSEKYEFNVMGQMQGQPTDGSTKAKFELTLPTGRFLSGDIDREAHMNKDKKLNGKMNLHFTDRLPSTKERKLSLTGEMKDADFKAGLYDLSYMLTYTDLEAKNVDVELKVKHLPKDHFKMAIVHMKLTGAIVPKPIEFNVDVDEYCEKHAIYHLVGSYGSDFDMKMDGKYEVAGRAKPATHELKANVNVPESKMKNMKFESSGSFLRPENDAGLYEISYTGLVSAAEKSVSVSTNAKGNMNHGSGDIKLQLPEQEPLSAEINYSHDDKEQDMTKTKGGLKLGYGQGKHVEFNGDLNTAGFDDITVHATFNSDIEKIKDIDVTFKHHKSNENTFTTNANMKADDKVYAFHSVMVASDNSPSIDVDLQYSGKDVKLYGAYTRLGDRKFKTEAKILNFVEFNFNGNMEVGYQSTEKFYVTADVDSPKLKLEKVHFEILSKPGGKGVEFKATSNDKNILSGSTDYTVKDDHGNTVYEGQGNVKLYEESKAASFKFIKNQFNIEKHGEIGYSYVFNGFVGTKNLVTEVKLTDKFFAVKCSVCEDKKQCTNFELLSKIKKTDFDKFDHELMISVDLRQLGYSHEFALKAETARNGFTIDHTMDVHLQSDDKPKYQYNVYIHKEKAGAAFTLPDRILALESTYQYPKQMFGVFDTSISLYLDKKNAPNNKATIAVSGETKRPSKNAVDAKAEFKFTHPAVKELVVTATGHMDGDKHKAGGKVVIDIFKNADQKIIAIAKYENIDHSGKGFNVTSDVSLTSPGLGFELGFSGHSALSVATKQLSAAASVNLPIDEFKFGSYLFVTPQEFYFTVNKFNNDILLATGSFDSDKFKADMKSTFKFFTATPIVLESHINGYKSAKFSLVKGDLLQVDGTFVLTKDAGLQIVGSGKDLFKGSIALDNAHFFKTEYKVDEAEIKNFLKTVTEETKKDYLAAKADVEIKFTKLESEVKKIVKNTKEALPDFTGIQTDYAEQLKKLETDLMADATFKEAFDFLTKIYMTLAESVGEMVKVYAEYFKKLTEIVKEFINNFVDSFSTKILPAIKELYGKVEKSIFNIYDETSNLLLAIFERIVKGLKTFEADFNKINQTISDGLKSFSQMFNKYFETVGKEFKEMWKLFTEYLESFPLIESIKEKYAANITKLKIPDNFWLFLKEITNIVREKVTIPEVRDFVDVFYKYIDMKSSKKGGDDIEQFKKMVPAFWKAVKAVFVSVYQLFNRYEEKATTGFYGYLPSFESFKLVPYVTNFKFSPFNYLKNEKWFSLKELLIQFRPYAWNPFAFLPPYTMRGQIADGSHFFTFDGRHFTFPGSCQYVLAADFIGKNFTLIANMEGGKMKSIVLMDKTDVVEINNEGIVTLNGNPTELPVHKKDMHAWRRYYTVSLLTTYGASVMCTNDLRVCHFTVSGFYLGKLRGLLGNGNGEPYDDFALPQGQITENPADFGNAYKIEGCAEVADSGHHNHEHSSELCSKFFTSSSSMKYCFMFKDQAKFREACEHAVHGAADPQDAACNIATMYASACRLDMIPISVPEVCGKCEHAGKAVDVGEYYSVKSPQKQADIVVVVDTSLDKILGELVQQTITDLREKLKGRGITDVHVAVIGYNKDEKYMSHYTTKGKLDFYGDLGQLKAGAGPYESKPLITKNEKVDEFLHKIHDILSRMKEDFALTSDAQAFRDAINYPFRASASKSIIAFRSDNLEGSASPLKSLYGLFASRFAEHKGVSLHVVTPVKDLTLTNSKDPKKAKEIVGFNSKTVLTFKDAPKKKDLGTTEMKNHLKYDSDLGVDLVENSNGYIFVMQNFKDGKQKKQFITVMTTALAEQFAKTEVHSDCVCELKYGLHAEDKCEAKETMFLGKKAGGRR